jgi:hypothetical protein
MKIMPHGLCALIADGSLILRAAKLLVKLFKTLKNKKTMFAKLIYDFHFILNKIELFLNKAISRYAIPSINFLEEIKKIIDNPIVDFTVITIAKLPFAEEIKAFLDKAIPQAVLALGIMQVDISAAPGQTPTTDDYIKALVQYLQEQPTELQDAALAKMASLLVRAGDGVITASRADSMVQIAYTTLKEKALAAAANATATKTAA